MSGGVDLFVQLFISLGSLVAICAAALAIRLTLPRLALLLFPGLWRRRDDRGLVWRVSGDVRTVLRTDPEAARTYREVRQATGVWSRRTECLVLFALLPALALVIGAVLQAGLLTVGMVLGVWIIVPLALGSIRLACAANALLGVRRCAACAYELRGVEPESDGCTVCPECGAGWRLPV